MSSTLPICIVCLNTSLEYIDLDTPFDAGQNEKEVQVIEVSAVEQVLTYLDCFRVCTRLEPLGNTLNEPQILCAACSLDLKVAYNFLQKAERADRKLREQASKSDIIHFELAEPDEEKVCTFEIQQPEEESANQNVYYEIELGRSETTYMDGGEDELSSSQVHNDVDPLDETAYECAYCDEIFLTMAFLKLHMAQMHSKSSKDLDADEKLKQDDVELADVMSANASEQDNAEQNEYIEDSDLDAKLEEETESSQCAFDLVPAADIANDTIFKCVPCTRTFDNRRALMQHHWRVHKRPKGITCKICQQTIKSNETMRGHLEGAHSHMVQCEKCDYKCKELQLMGHHRKVHEEQHDFSCNYCLKTFKSRGIRNAHMKYHELKEANIKSAACSVCGKQFSSQSYLTRHMAMHRVDRKVYQCPQCGKVYMTKSSLDTHLRVHRGETKQCLECGKRFARPNEFDIHMRFHNRTYPFICEVCGKCFAIKGHLRTHMWRHQGLKLQCGECGKLFISRKALHEHSFSHTTMPFPCAYCVKGYPSKQKYKMHLKTVHLVELDENELQKISRNTVPKPLQRRKLTLVQADSIMKEE